MLDWIAFGVTLIGYFIIIQYKHWIAFAVMIIADILWLVYYIFKHENSSTALMIVFILVYTWGLIKWRKK